MSQVNKPEDDDFLVSFEVVKDFKYFHALKEYAERRIKYFRDRLEIEQDHHKIIGYQATIKELKKLITLHDEVSHRARERGLK